MSLSADPSLLALIVGVFLLAGTVKGLVGIGLPTASVGMLSQAIDPRAAIVLVVFPSLLSNAWQVWRSGRMIETVRRYWVFAALLMGLNLLISITVMAQVPTAALMLIVGVTIVTFAATSLALSPPYLPQRYDRVAQGVAGSAAGVMGGLTGIWAPAMVTYLLARRVEKDDFVRATGVLIFLGTVPLVIGYATTGLLGADGAGLSLAMVVPAIAGFTIGEILRRRLDAVRFRTAVLVIFLLMGLNLIRRAVV